MLRSFAQDSDMFGKSWTWCLMHGLFPQVESALRATASAKVLKRWTNHKGMVITQTVSFHAHSCRGCSTTSRAEGTSVDCIFPTDGGKLNGVAL